MKIDSLPNGWFRFRDKAWGVNVHQNGILVLGKFLILSCGWVFPSVVLQRRTCWCLRVYLSWQRLHKQCESSKNGVTRDQMVQMKQNANTLVTQLQYFHMHMLQICLGRATTVFIQCHTLGRIKFLFWHTSAQSITLTTFPQEGKSKLGITLNKITVFYIFTQALPGEVFTYWLKRKYKPPNP